MPTPSAFKPLLAVTALAVAAACAPAATETMPAGGAVAAATPEMIAEGRSLFSGAGRCAVCHAPTGRGGSLGPDLTDDEWIWVDTSSPVRPQIAEIIRGGIEEPQEYPAPMPAMGGGNLAENQVQALAAYVESL